MDFSCTNAATVIDGLSCNRLDLTEHLSHNSTHSHDATHVRCQLPSTHRRHATTDSHALTSTNVRLCVVRPTNGHDQRHATTTTTTSTTTLLFIPPQHLPYVFPPYAICSPHTPLSMPCTFPLPLTPINTSPVPPPTYAPLQQPNSPHAAYDKQTCSGGNSPQFHGELSPLAGPLDALTTAIALHKPTPLRPTTPPTHTAAWTALTPTRTDTPLTHTTQKAMTATTRIDSPLTERSSLQNTNGSTSALTLRLRAPARPHFVFRCCTPRVRAAFHLATQRTSD